MGDYGYVRWEIDGQAIFEIPADSLTNPPQDTAQMNPKKIMIEEPMYVIFNVALSSSWGSSPPNAGDGDCWGDGTDDTTNAICDAFPMYLKIDYIRVYQDTSDGSDMAYGCDPSTHPTAQWIEDNIDDYTDTDNPWTEVAGMAFCDSNDDCTISSKNMSVTTGTCNSSGRCKCSSDAWAGPRCTTVASSIDDDDDTIYGPSMYVSMCVAALTFLCTALILVQTTIWARRETARFQEQQLKMEGAREAKEAKEARSSAPASESGAKANYSTNFV